MYSYQLDNEFPDFMESECS